MQCAFARRRFFREYGNFGRSRKKIGNDGGKLPARQKKKRALASLKKCASASRRAGAADSWERVVADNSGEKASDSQAPLPSGKISFAEHTGKIVRAKNEARGLLSALLPNAPAGESDTPEASVVALWELVFDYLCSALEMSVSEFNTLAGVIQKLAAARVQIINARDKNRGIAERRDSSDSSLAPESLEEIERRLNLL